MEITTQVWKIAVFAILVSPVINLVGYWALKSIKRFPTDTKDYFARLRQA